MGCAPQGGVIVNILVLVEWLQHVKQTTKKRHQSGKQACSRRSGEHALKQKQKHVFDQRIKSFTRLPCTILCDQSTKSRAHGYVCSRRGWLQSVRWPFGRQCCRWNERSLNQRKQSDLGLGSSNSTTSENENGFSNTSGNAAVQDVCAAWHSHSVDEADLYAQTRSLLCVLTCLKPLLVLVQPRWCLHLATAGCCRFHNNSRPELRFEVV